MHRSSIPRRCRSHGYGQPPYPGSHRTCRPLGRFQESLLELTKMVDQALQAERQKRRLTVPYFATAPRAVPRTFNTEAEHAKYIADVMMRFRATAG
jgi:hypothetical protein